MLNGRLAWPGLGLARLLAEGGWAFCGVSSWGVAMSGVIKTLARGEKEGCGEQDPVKLRQRRVLCVCYACQAVCTREGGAAGAVEVRRGEGQGLLCCLKIFRF